MDATADWIALGGSRKAGARRLVVVASVVLALVSGVVIGRETGAHPSVLPHRPGYAITATAVDSQDAAIRLRVMKKMNSILRGSSRPMGRGTR